jgi:hypothetical protein
LAAAAEFGYHGAKYPRFLVINMFISQRIVIETGILMGMNSVVRITVRKTFEIVLKDGQKIELEQDEAEEIRNALNVELPKVNGISSTNYMKNPDRRSRDGHNIHD